MSQVPAIILLTATLAQCRHSRYCDGVTRLELFDSFMADLLWEKELYPGIEVLRVKGLVVVKGEARGEPADGPGCA